MTEQHFYFLIFFAFLFCVPVWKYVHWSAAPILFWVIFCSLYLFPNQNNQYSHYQLLDKISFRFLSYESLCYTLLYGGVGLYLVRGPKKLFSWAMSALSWFLFSSALMTAVQFLYEESGHFRIGFLTNASMNGCLLAAGLPIVHRNFRGLTPAWLRWLPTSACVLAVVLTEASLPLGVLAGTVFALFLKRRPKLLWLAPVPLIVGYALMGGGLLSDSGRFGMWSRAITFWLEQGHIWMGFGLGSSAAWLPYIQQVTHYAHSNFYYPFFHSDWIQILFELGMIGFMLTLIPVSIALYRGYCRRDPTLFASFFGLCLCALANWPVHLPIGSFMISVLFVKLLVGHGYVHVNRKSKTEVSHRCGHLKSGSLRVPT